MELLEIIIYVLKLFSLSSFILLTMSYFFFKLKDRTRIKPYMLISTDPAVYEAPEEKPDPEKIKFIRRTRRFKVVNEERIMRQDFRPAQTRMEVKEVLQKKAPKSVPENPANIYSF